VIALCGVHGEVSSAKQGFSIGSLSRKDRETTTDVDLDGSRSDHDRLSQGFGYPRRDLLAFAFGSIRQQDRELVAAKSRYRVTVPRHSGEALGYLSQYLIACRVAECVIYVFEPIDVEDENDKLLSVAPSLLQCVIEAVLEEGTIGQVG
jgi:hypothetical protein